MLDPLKELINSTMHIQQLQAVKLLRVEAEVVVLRSMLVKSLAKQNGVDTAEIEEIFESTLQETKQRALAALRPALTNLSEDDIKLHLGLKELL